MKYPPVHHILNIHLYTTLNIHLYTTFNIHAYTTCSRAEIYRPFSEISHFSHIIQKSLKHDNILSARRIECHY